MTIIEYYVYMAIAYTALLSGAVYFSYKSGFKDGVLGTLEWVKEEENIDILLGLEDEQ